MSSSLADMESLFRQNHFELLQPLAQGSHGSVYVAKPLDSGKHTFDRSQYPEVVIKSIKKSVTQIPLNEGGPENIDYALAANAFATEKEVYNRIAKMTISKSKDECFEFLVKTLATFEDDTWGFVVMEKLHNMDLFDELHQNGLMNEERALKTLQDIVKGLLALKKLNIYHRDMKLENLVYSDETKSCLKVIDFSSCLPVVNGKPVKSNQICGTYNYLAPERLPTRENPSYDPSKSDIWAVGIISYLLISGASPFPLTDACEHFLALKGRLGVEDCIDGRKWIEDVKSKPITFPQEQWKGVSVNYKSFVLGLLAKDGTSRIRLETALEMIQLMMESPETEIDIWEVEKPIAGLTFLGMPLPLSRNNTRKKLNKESRDGSFTGKISREGSSLDWFLPRGKSKSVTTSLRDKDEPSTHSMGFRDVPPDSLVRRKSSANDTLRKRASFGSRKRTSKQSLAELINNSDSIEISKASSPNTFNANLQGDLSGGGTLSSAKAEKVALKQSRSKSLLKPKNLLLQSAGAMFSRSKSRQNLSAES